MHTWERNFLSFYKVNDLNISAKNKYSLLNELNTMDSESPLKVKLVHDLKEAKRLWNRFSPQKTLWDRWEIVASFYDPALHEINFFVLGCCNNSQVSSCLSSLINKTLSLSTDLKDSL